MMSTLEDRLTAAMRSHGDARLLDADRATGHLSAAPDWAGCRLPTFDGTLGPVPEDPVAIAMCGPSDPRVGQTVWVAGASEAAALAKRLAESPAGMWIDTCVYEDCVETQFALLQPDGSVLVLVLSQAGADYAMSGRSDSWLIDASLASDFLGLRRTGMSYVYPRTPTDDAYPARPQQR